MRSFTWVIYQATVPTVRCRSINQLSTYFRSKPHVRGMEGGYRDEKDTYGHGRYKQRHIEYHQYGSHGGMLCVVSFLAQRWSCSV